MTAKERIIDICLEELVGTKTPPDLKDSIMRAWEAEVASQPADSRKAAAERQTDGVNAIIDVCLSEVLAGNQPPNLTDQILTKFSASESPSIAPPVSCNGDAQYASPPPVDQQTVAQRTSIAQPQTRRRRAQRKYQNSTGIRWLSAACILVVGTVIGIAVLRETQTGPERFADRTEPSADGSQAETDHGAGTPTTKRKTRRPGLAGTNGETIDPTFRRDDSLQQPRAVAPRRTQVAADPEEPGDIVAQIDDYIQSRWVEHAVRPVGYANDLDWVSPSLCPTAGKNSYER